MRQLYHLKKQSEQTLMLARSLVSKWERYRSPNQRRLPSPQMQHLATELDILGIPTLPLNPNGNNINSKRHYPLKPNLLTARSTSPDSLECRSIATLHSLTKTIENGWQTQRSLEKNQLIDRSSQQNQVDIELLEQSRQLYKETNSDLEYYKSKALYAQEEAEYLRNKLLTLFHNKGKK